MNIVKITKTTGFNYYARGTVTFDVDGKEVELSTIHSPNKFLELTAEARELNEELVMLLNAVDLPDEEEDEAEYADTVLDVMNSVLEDGEFPRIAHELLVATATIEDLFAGM